METENTTGERALAAQDDVLGIGDTVVTKAKPLTLQRLCFSQEKGR